MRISRHVTPAIVSLPLLPVVALAAPGDIVSVIDLKPACDPVWNFTGGLAFDGSVLYYTILFTGDPGAVYRYDTKARALLGSFRPKRGGVPIAGDFPAFGYDANRHCLWMVTRPSPLEVSCVSLANDEVVAAIFPSQTPSYYTIDHDPYLDVVWISNGNPQQVYAWRMNNNLYNTAFGPALPVNGLAFDGTYLWNYTGDTPPLPAPQVNRVMYPIDDRMVPDYTKAFALDDREYQDMAYDCRTFPVPVIWAAHKTTCEIVAYEIPPPPAPCLNGPTNRLLRASVPKPAEAGRTAVLPVRLETSDWVWGARTPMSVRDDADGMLGNQDRPLAFYRLTGPNDADLPRVIKLRKDAPAGAIVIEE